MQSEQEDTLWTVDDVARFLRCSPSKVYKLAARGGVPSVHVGSHLRFDPEALRAWAKRQTTQGDVR